MTRIYLPRRRNLPRLEPRDVKKALDAHFAPQVAHVRAVGYYGEPYGTGVIHDVFSPQGPWITYDAFTTREIEAAAELYWPAGGWEVAQGWRASADGARPASTRPTGPVGPAGRAAANGVPAWLGPNR